MADYVVNAVFQDNISQGAQAAATALNNAADAFDTLSTKVTKATASAQASAAKWDQLTQTTNALAKAQQVLATQTQVMNVGLAAGTVTQAQVNGTLDTLQQKVLAAQKAVAALSPTVNTATTSTGQMSFAMRQLEVQAEQAIAGIATGQPVWMTLIQQGHQVTDVMTETGISFKAMATGLLGMLSPTVLVIAGVAAVGAAIYEMGSSAETAQTQMIALQNQLRATRDDYTAMAKEVQAAARASVTGSFTKADTLSAGQTIAAQPNFQGTQQQLQSLIATAENMALVFNETLPQAAQTLAKAFQDPGSVAEDLANKNFPAMKQALADSVVQMQNAGDKAGAFNTVLNAINAGTAGTKDHLTPLQQALQNLDDAFKHTGTSGENLNDVVGNGIAKAAAVAVNALTSVVSSIDAVWKAATTHTANPLNANSGSLVGMTPDQYVQPDANLTAPGNVLTSSAGARGIFQLMPSSFPFTNVDDPNSNITAGLGYLEALLQRGYGVNDALGSYNLGPTGYANNPAAATGYINSVLAANPKALTGQTITTNGQQMTVAQAIRYWGTQLGMPQSDIDIGLSVATVESGGRQFAPNSTATAISGPATPFPSPNDIAGAVLPAGAGSANGFAVANPNDAATKLADSILGGTGTSGNSFADTLDKANGELKQLYAAQQALGPVTDANSAAFDKFQAAIDKVNASVVAAVGPAGKLIDADQQQIANNEALAAAYAQGGDAVQQVTAQQKAQADLLQQNILPGMANYADSAAKVTAANMQVSQSAQDVANAQQTAQNNNQLQYIQAETDSLGMNNDQRTAMLAALQAEINLKNQGKDVTLQSAQADIQSAAAVAEGTAKLNDQKAALDSLAQSFTSAFDSIGQAITQAFVQGQGAAVNWKNVMDSVIEQVLQKVLQVAVLNPLLNSLIPGQSNPTLTSTIAALNAASGAASTGSSNGSFGGVGTILQAGSLANTASGGGILNALGLGNLTGPGGLFGNIGSTISGVLSTPLIGGFTSADVAAAGSMSPTALLAAQDAALTGGTATGASLTIGSLLGGAGLGFGAGSLLDSLLGAKNSTVGTIGSGVGGLAGAAIGSLLGPAGTLLGGLFGGRMGGASGFISKRKPS